MSNHLAIDPLLLGQIEVGRCALLVWPESLCHIRRQTNIVNETDLVVTIYGAEAKKSVDV